MLRKRTPLLMLVAGILAMASLPAAIAADDQDADDFEAISTGDLYLVSTSSSGVKGNDSSFTASVSKDGTKVAFASFAANLHAGDTTPDADIYVKDLVTGGLTLVSRVGVGGTKANGDSYTPSLSASGTKVAFTSYATNLHAADGSDDPDIYVKDLVTGGLTLVSRIGVAGAKANGFNFNPSLSADGSKVAFTSRSTNLHPSDTDIAWDVYVKDLTTGELVVASTTAAGPKANGDSTTPSLSSTGTKVAFTSHATNLHPDDTDTAGDVFVKDLATGAVVLASRSGARGAKGNSSSGAPALSGDGKKVAFHTSASNLHPADPDASWDVMLKDLSTGALTLVSRVGLSGVKSEGFATRPSLSADGTKASFWSNATNLHPGDTDAVGDIYVKDMVTGHIVVASSSAGGVKGNGNSDGPRMTPGGTAVVFDSSATNLHPTKRDTFWDVVFKSIPLCAGRLATIAGSSASNTIIGTAGADVIWAGAGNDTVNGGGGNDIICGGPGNDTLNGGAGNDVLYGATGDDTLRGGAGSDTLRGEAGSNKLFGDAGNDLLYGGAGSDVLDGGVDADKVWGDGGSDTLNGGAGSDELRAGAGNDTLKGGGGADKLWGQAGNDALRGGAGNDILQGGAGADKVWGAGGKDTLRGGAGNDGLSGGAGNDTILGGSGADKLGGGKGNDVLNGGPAKDVCSGGAGRDKAKACETRKGIP